VKIAHIVGARPQFVKLAPLSRVIMERHHEIIIHSGQHYDYQMNEVFFRDLGIPAPDYYLGIGSGHQGKQTGETMVALEPILEKERPDWVIVYGDTNTTLAGALTSVKLQLRTAHVEAGLRSFNRSMPEEINRIVSDHTCDLLLAPTPTAMKHLAHEGLAQRSTLVGDIMVDSLKLGLSRIDNQDELLGRLGLVAGEYFLLTLHRPYNVDDPERLEFIISKLAKLGTKIVFPVHPRTAKVLQTLNLQRFPQLNCLEPLAYLDFLAVMHNAGMMLTDSGGIQKEAYLLQVPCVTLRSETEWTETVEGGWNMLLPVDSAEFPEAINRMHAPLEHPEIFGSNVAQKITEALETWS